MGRWSKAAIEDRRRNVFEFCILKGMSETAVAQQMGVHRNTIVADVRNLREEMRARVKDVDPATEIGAQAQKYERLAEEALVEAAASAQAGAKAQLMGQALRAMELRQRLLMETGFLPMAAKTINGELKLSGGLDLTKMTTEELRGLRGSLLERLNGRTAAQAS